MSILTINRKGIKILQLKYLGYKTEKRSGPAYIPLQWILHKKTQSSQGIPWEH